MFLQKLRACTPCMRAKMYAWLSLGSALLTKTEDKHPKSDNNPSNGMGPSRILDCLVEEWLFNPLEELSCP
jgi:hypothetical protein